MTAPSPSPAPLCPSPIRAHHEDWDATRHRKTLDYMEAYLKENPEIGFLAFIVSNIRSFVNNDYLRPTEWMPMDYSHPGWFECVRMLLDCGSDFIQPLEPGEEWVDARLSVSAEQFKRHQQRQTDCWLWLAMLLFRSEDLMAFIQSYGKRYQTKKSKKPFDWESDCASVLAHDMDGLTFARRQRPKPGSPILIDLVEEFDPKVPVVGGTPAVTDPEAGTSSASGNSPPAKRLREGDSPE